MCEMNMTCANVPENYERAFFLKHTFSLCLYGQYRHEQIILYVKFNKYYFERVWKKKRTVVNMIIFMINFRIFRESCSGHNFHELTIFMEIADFSVNQVIDHCSQVMPTFWNYLFNNRHLSDNIWVTSKNQRGELQRNGTNAQNWYNYFPSMKTKTIGWRIARNERFENCKFILTFYGLKYIHSFGL